MGIPGEWFLVVSWRILSGSVARKKTLHFGCMDYLGEGCNDFQKQADLTEHHSH